MLSQIARRLHESENLHCGRIMHALTGIAVAESGIYFCLPSLSLVTKVVGTALAGGGLNFASAGIMRVTLSMDLSIKEWVWVSAGTLFGAAGFASLPFKELPMALRVFLGVTGIAAGLICCRYIVKQRQGYLPVNNELRQV